MTSALSLVVLLAAIACVHGRPSHNRGHYYNVRTSGYSGYPYYVLNQRQPTYYSGSYPRYYPNWYWARRHHNRHGYGSFYPDCEKHPGEGTTDEPEYQYPVDGPTEEPGYEYPIDGPVEPEPDYPEYPEFDGPTAGPLEPEYPEDNGPKYPTEAYPDYGVDGLGDVPVEFDPNVPVEDEPRQEPDRFDLGGDVPIQLGPSFAVHDNHVDFKYDHDHRN